jgi:hypothetical protein
MTTRASHNTGNADDIRRIIRRAQNHESSTHLLITQLENNSSRLHTSIRLPKENSSQILVRFITRYIQHVPDFIDAIDEVSNQAGITHQTTPLLDIARNYFFQPPTLIQDHKGLNALMDEAYLAHRLIEEINDYIISLCGIPLTPMDMTRANLIIHHLIGEPFANELDNTVRHSVKKVIQHKENFQTDAFNHYIEEHKQRGWQQELTRWPCLAEDLSIALDFSNDPLVNVEVCLPVHVNRRLH